MLTLNNLHQTDFLPSILPLNRTQFKHLHHINKHIKMHFDYFSFCQCNVELLKPLMVMDGCLFKVSSHRLDLRFLLLIPADMFTRLVLFLPENRLTFHL